jgi:hypothetical protein
MHNFVAGWFVKKKKLNGGLGAINFQNIKPKKKHDEYKRKEDF